ncbi:hypothetical protein BC941DRAFT_432130 [Chlamydoabsidia padenii]|nr:hypothetical protein BC941DRAFT_432130 [Chlamydoabsidia padenii]
MTQPSIDNGGSHITYNSIHPSCSTTAHDHHSCQDSTHLNERTPLLLRQQSNQTISDIYDDPPASIKEQELEVGSPLQDLSLTRLLERASLSVYLENKGSVARDHLANERTYLAWLRTSLSLISVGVALTQLFRLDKTSHHPQGGLDDLLSSGRLVGLMFVVLGILFVLFAISRYFHSQQALTKGYFPASRGTVLVASSTVSIAVIILFIIIIH